MTQRVINFSPGPAMLPLGALQQAQKDILDFDQTGMSILEHSHRGKHYAAVHEESIQLLRDLMSVPDDYEILLMQGGAAAQVAHIPTNLIPAEGSADYVVTGTWSEKALQEAQVLGSPQIAATTLVNGSTTRVPTQHELKLNPNAAYVHLTSNNTIYGTQFHRFPETGAVPLIADMSSDILSRRIDVRQFGLIYACAQKNLGPAGITVVMIHKDLVAKAPATLPKIFRYSTIAKANSLQNTITTFAVYMMRNVLQWVRDQGGLQAIEAHNQKKADALYGVIDTHPEMYHCPVEKDSRSQMNAVFRLPDADKEAAFLSNAAQVGLVNLKGHRSVGGIRVSMYNAMLPEHIDRLVNFMQDFAKA